MKIQLKFMALAFATFNLTNAASGDACKEVFDILDSTVRQNSSTRIQPKINDDQAQDALLVFKKHCACSKMKCNTIRC